MYLQLVAFWWNDFGKAHGLNQEGKAHGLNQEGAVHKQDGALVFEAEELR